MRIKWYFIIVGLLLFVGGNPPLFAQEDSTFNPETPAEPNVLYRVRVTAEPLQAVSSLSGAGDYALGTEIYVEAGSYSPAYIFSHWTKNGEEYDGTSTSFFYTVSNEDAEFVAHYTYSPSLPDEPQSSNEWRLYLLSAPLGGGNFSCASGEKHECGTAVEVTAYCNMGYDFVGWYNGGTLVSTNPSISYEMQNCHATLTAKFEYNPSTPSEPGWTEDNQQENIDKFIVGDADGNGEVSVNDVVVIINTILSSGYDRKADVDGNGEVSVNDAVTVVNMILGTIE
ncbi:MAG: dockerin type I repeat-containing protein [Bacteroidaceae bacterium]|nr:dockerin type I repeat-containing protein [Bacteroidaceae bacterium]